MVCKSVSEIKDHAKNFPNASRTFVYGLSDHFVMCLDHLYKATHCVPNLQGRRWKNSNAREDGYSVGAFSELHSSDNRIIV